MQTGCYIKYGSGYAKLFTAFNSYIAQYLAEIKGEAFVQELCKAAA